VAARNGTRASRQTVGILGRLHRFAFLFLVMGGAALMVLDMVLDSKAGGKG